jgi:hypothetical protein
MHTRFVLAISAASMLLACGDSAPAQGTERGRCFPDGSCTGTLQCASDVCVDLVAAGQALTDALNFEGGILLPGDVPPTTLQDVTLTQDNVMLLLGPDTAPTDMLLGFDNPRESVDPVESTLLEFDGANKHIKVAHTPGNSGGAATQIKLHFSVNGGVCDHLCNRVFQVQLTQAAQLKSGGVGRTASRILSLDCSKRGDATLCTGDEAGGPGAGAPGGKRDASVVVLVDAGTSRDASVGTADSGPTVSHCEWTSGNANQCSACSSSAAATCALSKYTDNKDGTVTSSCCGLVWQQMVEVGVSSLGVSGEPGEYLWDQANSYCAGLPLPGAGWRLPTIVELASIVVPNQTLTTTIDTTAFPNTAPLAFWSSTPVTGSADQAWTVDFNGGLTIERVTSLVAAVRCVR